MENKMVELIKKMSLEQLVEAWERGFNEQMEIGPMMDFIENELCEKNESKFIKWSEDFDCTSPRKYFL